MTIGNRRAAHCAPPLFLTGSAFMKNLPALQQHDLRRALHNEVHSRPPEAIADNTAVFCVVMLANDAERLASRQCLHQLLRDLQLPVPDAEANHLRLDLGNCRLRWELHTEFVSWTWMLPLSADMLDDTDLPSASDAVPAQWLAGLPGQCLMAMNLWVLQPTPVLEKRAEQRWLYEDKLVASEAAEQQARIYTDFAIHSDGASRLFVFNQALEPARTGRLVQRLLEIETYRMAALLGLPAARQTMDKLAATESELAQLSEAIRSAGVSSEPQLLDQLTRLAAQVESQYAAHHSRFSASSAYFALVQQRVGDIQETRLGSYQTIRDFMDRRLTPARSTCVSAHQRLEALSQRVSRISNLLQTRVDISQKQGRQAVLKAMNERQGLQLKMQSTVEGLSVAAITYYFVGLISYLAKGLQKWGWPLSPETTAALAIPVVGLGVWWSIRRMHHRLFHGSADQH